MKFSCNSIELSEICQNVQRAASTKTSIPAIEGILLKVQEHEVIATGYDLEAGITASIEAVVEKNGSIILNAKILCDILRKLPSSRVMIEADERQLCAIRSGEAEYSIIGISSEEYPELPSVKGGYPIIIPRKTLKEMIRQTQFAVAVNDAKIVHTGIKFEIGGNIIRLIAVDGFRLAVRSEAVSYDGEEKSFIVPSKTLSEVMKLINDDSGDVALSIGKRHIVFELDGYSIVSRLLEGDFLDYKAAVPTNFITNVRVKTASLSDSIERTSLIITDKLKSPIRCIFDDHTIKISSVTSLGTASDRLSAEIEGERLEIGFNNRFFLDALKASDTDEVQIKMGGPLSPIVILPPEGDSFLFLVLPVRLKNEY